MKILGIETSCDECSAALVADGRVLIDQIIATQIDLHREFYGVVPEIASRLHTEWIWLVVDDLINRTKIQIQDIDGVAVTSRPGLTGSLQVGLAFAKSFALARGIPFVAIDHLKAHLYAAHLESEIPYPHLGLIVSGGHTLICQVDGFDDYTVLGTTIDDACGEAFDKVAKYYDMGYPGGQIIDNLAKNGDPKAFLFPKPFLKKRNPLDVSYSGLKTAVINQLEQFRCDGALTTPENIAASFQKTAIDILISRVKKAIKETGLSSLVAGGGVTANSYLRSEIKAVRGLESFFPSLSLCADNGAMVAGLGFQYLSRGMESSWDSTVSSRVIAR